MWHLLLLMFLGYVGVMLILAALFVVLGPIAILLDLLIDWIP